MAGVRPHCDICAKAIFHHSDKYRLQSEGGRTRLGEIFHSELSAQGELSYTAGSLLACRHCRDLLFRLHKTRGLLSALQKELSAKLSSTSTCQSTPVVPRELAATRTLIPRPVDRSSKRTLSSPAASTGVSPAIKRPFREAPTSPITHHSVSCHRVQIQQVTRPSAARSLFPSQALPTLLPKPINPEPVPDNLPFDQEMVTVKVYEQLEDHPQASIKVKISHLCNHNLLVI